MFHEFIFSVQQPQISAATRTVNVTYTIPVPCVAPTLPARYIPSSLTSQYPTVPMPPVTRNVQPPVDYYQQMRQQQVYHGMHTVTGSYGSQQFSDANLFRGYQQRVVVSQASYIQTGSSLALGQQNPVLQPTSVVQPVAFIPQQAVMQPVPAIQQPQMVQAHPMMQPTSVIQHPVVLQQPQILHRGTMIQRQQVSQGQIMQPAAYVQSFTTAQPSRVVQPITTAIPSTAVQAITTAQPSITTADPSIALQTITIAQPLMTTADPSMALQTITTAQPLMTTADPSMALQTITTAQPLMTTVDPSIALQTITTAQPSDVTPNLTAGDPETVTTTFAVTHAVPIVQDVAITTNTVAQVQQGQPIYSPTVQEVPVSTDGSGAPIYTTANTLPPPSSGFLELTPQQEIQQKEASEGFQLDPKLTTDQQKHLRTSRARGRNVAISSLPQMHDPNEPENPTMSLRY